MWIRFARLLRTGVVIFNKYILFDTSSIIYLLHHDNKTSSILIILFLIRLEL